MRFQKQGPICKENTNRRAISHRVNNEIPLNSWARLFRCLELCVNAIKNGYKTSPNKCSIIVWLSSKNTLAALPLSFAIAVAVECIMNSEAIHIVIFSSFRFSCKLSNGMLSRNMPFGTGVTFSAERLNGYFCAVWMSVELAEHRERTELLVSSRRLVWLEIDLRGGIFFGFGSSASLCRAEQATF